MAGGRSASEHSCQLRLQNNLRELLQESVRGDNYEEHPLDGDDNYWEGLLRSHSGIPQKS